MLPSASLQFRRLFDPYYWRTALLISQNMVGAQYRNSFLGNFWTLLQPVTMVLVYTLIMPLILHAQQNDYVFFVVASLPLWTYISATLTGAGLVIFQQGETLKRCMISSTVFPVADVLKHTYTYGVSFISMYIVASLLFWRFDPIVFLVPLYILPVVIILMAMGIGLAFVSPYVRDVSDAVQIGFNVFFWLTPIIYPITVLPQWAQDVMMFNPLYVMIRPVQMLAYEHTLPSVEITLRLIALTLLAVALGYTLYRACRRNYVYYL